jgi:YVTN family beta-propeller protein
MQVAMKLSIKSGMRAIAFNVFALHALAFAITSQAIAFTAYVSNEKGNSISIIETDKLAVTKTVPVGHRPRGIALNKDGSELYICAGDDDLIQILELMVTQLNQNLAQKSITVTVTDEAKKWILNQTLGDRSYGARPLRRALQKYIEDPLSEALIQGTIATRPAFIEVFLGDNKLFYRPVDSKETEGVLLYEK